MIKIRFLPDDITVEGQTGESLLDLAFKYDVIMNHNCGGVCACSACYLIVEKGMNVFNPVSENEKFQLDYYKKTDPKGRLGCQCVIENENENDVIVTIPETTEEEEIE